MKRLWAIFKKDWRAFLRDPKAVLLSSLLPIGMMLVVGFAFSGGGDWVIELAVVDSDGGEAAKTLLATITDTGVCELVPLPDEAAARTALSDNDYAAALLIPAGFTDAVEKNLDAGLTLLTNPRRDVELRVLENLVQGASIAPAGKNVALRMADRFLDETAFVSPQAREDVRGEIRSYITEEEGSGGSLDWQDFTESGSPVRVTTEEVRATAAEWDAILQYVPGYAVMFALFGAASAAAGVLAEREKGLARRILTSPLSLKGYLLGKSGFLVTLPVAQMGLLFGFGAVAFGAVYPGSTVALLLVSLCVVIASVGLALALLAFCRTAKQIDQLGLLVILVMSALGGSWWPLFITPEWMQSLAHVTINAWAMDAYAELFTFGGGLGDVLVPCLVLLGYGVVGFLLALWRYRPQEVR
ncbi:MAG: ABC transporter permease [bacterium]|nr:ABC transporter permease [bacterium]